MEKEEIQQVGYVFTHHPLDSFIQMANRCKSIPPSHQFLEESDFANKQFWKLKVFKFTLKRYRELNPNSYIMLVGHGRNIPKDLLEYVDWSYWHNELITNDINNK